MTVRTWAVPGLLLSAVALSACGTRVPAAQRHRAEAPLVTSVIEQVPAGTILPTGAASGSQASGAVSPVGGAAAAGPSPAAGPVGPAAGASASVPRSGARASQQPTSAKRSASGAGTSAAAGGQVVLGNVGTLSGVAGAQLKSINDGATVWVSYINAHGGLAGHQVKLITIDDQDDPGQYAAAIRSLIQNDHVVAFLGNVAPLTFSAGTSVLEQYGVPAIGGDSSEAGWFNSPLAFPVNSYIVPLGKPQAVWAAANLPKVSKAAVFYLTEAAVSKQIAQVFSDAYTAAGKQVVLNQSVSITNPDYTSQVLSAQNAGAQAVFMDLDSASCTRFWNSARRQQYHPVYFMVGCDDAAFSADDETFGNAYISDGHMPIVPGTPAADEFIAAAKAYGPPNMRLNNATRDWLGGKLLEQAVAAGGGVRSQDIVKGLHSLKSTTLGGLSPAETWPAGNHTAGMCGVVEGIDSHGELQLETPNFLC